MVEEAVLSETLHHQISLLQSLEDYKTISSTYNHIQPICGEAPQATAYETQRDPTLLLKDQFAADEDQTETPPPASEVELSNDAITEIMASPPCLKNMSLPLFVETRFLRDACLKVPLMQTLTKNDDGMADCPRVPTFVENHNPLFHLSALPGLTEQVISDLYAVLRHHEKAKTPMPPTARFKAHSLLNFVFSFELFSMLLPQHIKLSLEAAYRGLQFNEFYCACGCVCAQEAQFLYHLRCMHLPVAKYLLHIKAPHVQVCTIQFDDILSADRLAQDSVLGSVEAQKQRLIRLIWLLRELPKVPKPPNCFPAFTFTELFHFESGELELKFNLDKQKCKQTKLLEKAREKDQILKQHTSNAGGDPDMDKDYGCSRIRIASETKVDELEHESFNTAFKHQYVFSKAEERSFCDRQHLRQATLYGHQAIEDRVGQIPAFSAQCLARVRELLPQLEVYDQFDVESIVRREIRQLLALNIQMELMSMFTPHVVGPSIQVQLAQVKAGGFKNFMCTCNALFKDEPSYRAHFNATHKQINDMVCQLQDVVTFQSLHRIDFALLGDTSPREQYEDLLGTRAEQTTRITKWFKFRHLIRHSD